jgi:hypothetical protein
VAAAWHLWSAEANKWRSMPHKKINLPDKIRVVCGRRFHWRKKWEKVWNEVKYCCEKCRSSNKTDDAGKLNRYETRIVEEE